MGVFYEQVEIVNRTSKPLNVRFDGQDMVLEPNYSETGERLTDVKNMIPAIAADHAKSQNVRMGSENPVDPTDYEVLVGLVAKKGGKQKDDISYLEDDEEALTRVKLEDYIDDPSAHIVVRGRKKDARARRGEATAPRLGQTPFEVRAS